MSPPVAAAPPGRWLALAVLATGMLLGMAPWLSATAVLPELTAAWHLAPGWGAWLTIAVQLGFVAGALMSATLNLADRANPRRLMALGAVAAGIANLGVLVVTTPTGVIAVRVATGMCLALVYPPAMKAMAAWFHRDRGLALGVMVGALALGSALPHLINGLGGLAWEPVIVASSALSIGGGLIVWIAGRDGPLSFPSAPFDPKKAFRALANRGVRLACIGYWGHMWELYAMWAWFGLFFSQALSRAGIANSTAWSALASFACIGIGALGCLVAGRVADGWGRSRTTIVCMSVSGACAASVGWLGPLGWPVLLVVGLIWGISVIADSAQFSTLVTELGDQATIGSALTLQLALGFALTAPSLWLIPWLAERFGWGAAFLALAAGPLIGIVAMMRLAPLEARQVRN